jgi:hypothetical protein
MIIYLHGFASSGQSLKVDLLREEFGDNEVIAPDLPFDPDKVENLVDEIIQDNWYNKQHPIIFVGTSLGAFYANYFAHVYDCPAMLVNPSISPDITLKDRIGLNKRYMSNDEFLVTLAHLDSLQRMKERIKESYNGRLINLFLAMNDEVIDYRDVIHNFPYFNSINVKVDGGHRFEEHWGEVVEKVRELYTGKIR